MDSSWDIARRTARFRVAVPVIGPGNDVRPTAMVESLSRNGMFVRGLRGAAIGDRFSLDLELGDVSASCEVRIVHELDPAEAERLDRSPGVGVEFVSGDEAFDAALERYLVRLERRAERRLLVLGERPALLLAACGYQVERAVPPLAGALRDVDGPLYALVVPRAEASLESAVPSAGLAAGVVTMDGDRDLDAALQALDAAL